MAFPGAGRVMLALGQGGGGPVNPFPNASNTGYLNAPGYPGSLTPLDLTTIVDGATYSFRDIDSGSGTSAGNTINATNVTFIGCRFQSNDLANYNVGITTSKNVTFLYCSIVPRTVQATQPPGGFVWPSRTSGQITYNQGYQYGLFVGASAGNVIVDHCDIWGFGNGIDFDGRLASTKILTVTNNWIHDARADGGIDHTDGIAHTGVSTTAQSGITITGNTVALIGNTNALGFQGGSGAAAKYTATVTGNYFTGDNTCVDIRGTGNVITFTGNTFSTALQWASTALHVAPTTMFDTVGSFSNNKLLYVAGTSPAGGSLPAWVPGDNGKFFWPNNTLNATDYVPPIVTYSGPGDVKSGWISYYALRAYSAAEIGANAVKLRRDSDNTTQVFVTLSTGALDVASISTFKGAANLFVDTIYDQVGTKHYAQATTSLQPAFSLTGGPNNGPRIIAADGTRFASVTGITQSQPFAFSALAKRTGATSSTRSLITSFTTGFTQQVDLSYAGTVNTGRGSAPNGGNSAVSDNVWHSLDFVPNGASGFFYKDGVDNIGFAFNFGANTIAPTDTVHLLTTVFGEDFNGDFVEGGICAGAYSSSDAVAISSNRATYYGY